jgi:hypothetical protein
MAAKVAGLAKPEPAVIPTQSLPCLPWGDAYDPMMMLKHGPECVSWPTVPAAAPKTDGLAKLVPEEEFALCGLSEQLDPLLDPLALVCLSQPGAAAKAVSRPVGLAAPTQMRPGPCGPGGESPDPLSWACMH